ncbi:hypothetical protein TrCOL_g11341 [Triparma columacea]|uniref:Uncharacterized protein n=1 Tax=Triparma columacea TaxID=722753 RepID=A0A9W7GAP3_9STRA|nr:hypothetical protein TrCOL_g11341 [Triparma columacea]
MKKISTHAPRCLMRSPQKRPMRSPQTEPKRLPETDPMRSPQTSARVHVPWPPPVELDAEGQALRKRLRTFRTQAGVVESHEKYESRRELEALWALCGMSAGLL